MKTITYDLSAFYGYGCSGMEYGSEETYNLEVTDEAAATIAALMAKGDVDTASVQGAIEEGHSELQKVMDDIEEQQREMVAWYWLFDADHECIDESLEPAFWKDIADGIFQPQLSIAQCVELHRDDEDLKGWDLDDEDNQRSLYYDQMRDDYLDWVNDHKDNLWFIADRVGVDLGAVYGDMPELEFVITELE